MDNQTIKSLVAMACITSLEAIVIVFLGIDGAILSLVVAGLAGLGGYELAKRKEA